MKIYQWVLAYIPENEEKLKDSKILDSGMDLAKDEKSLLLKLAKKIPAEYDDQLGGI